MNRQNKGIGIIAPSFSMSYIDKELIRNGITRLESMGFIVKIGKNVYKNLLYTAGTIEERISDIDDFLTDPEIDVIMAAFGGYNSNQLIEHLNFEKIEKAKKLFIGYSDTTAILNAIYKKTQLKTLLGPAFVNFCDPNIFSETIHYFLKAIHCESNVEYLHPEFYAYDDWFKKEGFGPREKRKHKGWNFIKPGFSSGTLIGGNCETLLALAGTEYFPDTKNGVLLLEAVPSERSAKFDRELTQLKQMGVFNSITGLILGQFGDDSQLSFSDILSDLVLEKTKEFSFPIATNLSFSHVDPVYTIPIGSKVSLCSERNIIYYDFYN